MHKLFMVSGIKSISFKSLFFILILFQISIVSGQSLINGGEISGSISFPDEEDTYTFSGQAGEGILIQAADISGNSSFFPGFNLYGPDGGRITYASDSRVARLSWTLPENGLYTVVVSDHSVNEATGDYKLYFTHAPGANEGGELPNGGVIAESIELGDLDSYTFSGQAGEGILIQVADISGNSSFFPGFNLYGPDGERITYASDSRVARLSWTLPENGLYTVVVSDHSINGATGDYNLYFIHAPGANEGGELSNGGVIAESIELGDLDSYTFPGQAGESILIQIVETASGNAGFFPGFNFYGPDGGRITYGSGSRVARLSWTLPENGLYTVVVSDHSINGAIGNYTLSYEITNNLLSYAALGDSYSSGEGVWPYYDTTKLLSGCHRSTRAYSNYVRVPGTNQAIADRNDASFDFFACSGAVTNNITASGEGQHDEPPQLAAVNRVDATRDLVTISIGGNDAGFVYIVGYCLAHNHCHDLKPFDPHIDLELGDLFSLWVIEVQLRLLDVFTELKNAAPNAGVVVAGYPFLLSGEECSAVKMPFYEEAKLSESEQVFLRDANKQLNDAVERAARLVGLHFVDIAEHFEGHEICSSSDDWVHGLVPLNPKASFHPTRRGQIEYARAINKYLENISIAWPFGYFSTGLPKNPDASSLLDDSKWLNKMQEPMVLPEFGNLETVLSNADINCPDAQALVIPGELVTVKGVGFAPSETVHLSLIVNGQKYDLGTLTADVEGKLESSIAIPETIPVGNIGSLEASGGGSNGAGLLLIDLVRVESSISVDGDGDGIPDGCDNCPATANYDQRDLDGDGRGDVCDSCAEEFINDEDGDGLCQVEDVCPFDADNDVDGDQFCSIDDNCPVIYNPDQLDDDGDGIGNACPVITNPIASASFNNTVLTLPVVSAIGKHYRVELNLRQAGNFEFQLGGVEELSNPDIRSVSVFGNNQLQIPEVIVGNTRYSATLTLIDPQLFIFALSGYQELTQETGILQ